LFDPIFQGMAVALMFGEVAATLLSRTMVPVLYYLLKKRHVEEKPGASNGTSVEGGSLIINNNAKTKIE
jgi:Cu/Ag efflux pump CusA